MKLYVFIQQLIKIKCNLQDLFSEQNAQAILFTHSNYINNISDENKNAFSRIYVLEQLNCDEISSILDNIITGFAKEDIRIMTNEDCSLLLAAQLRERYAIDGSTKSAILPFVDKLAMKDKLQESAIRMPKYLLFDNEQYLADSTTYLHKIITHLGFPMIAKPVVGFGSYDTKVLYDQDELVQYADFITSIEIPFELDEFIDGQLYHCDGLIKNNKIELFFTCRYNVPCLEFLNGHPLGSLMIPNDNPLHSRLKNFTQIVAQQLIVPDGAYHLEVFVTNKQELIFLEIAARSPGAFVPQLYEQLYSFNLEILHYQSQLGSVNITQPDTNKKYGAFIMYPTKQGIVAGYNTPDMSSDYDIYCYQKIDQLSKQANFLGDIAVGIVLVNTSYDVLCEDFNYLTTYQPVVYKNEAY